MPTVRDGTEPRAAQQLRELCEPEHPPWFTALVRQLLTILTGDRHPALAADPDLEYMNAAELTLLLDSLRPPCSG